MKLYIDDIRDPPDDTWTVARTSQDAIYILRNVYATQVGLYPTSPGDDYIEVISFDHDLGGDDTTMPVMQWLQEHGLWPDRLIVHSANPVGRKNLLTIAWVDGPDDLDLPQKWEVAGR